MNACRSFFFGGAETEGDAAFPRIAAIFEQYVEGV